MDALIRLLGENYRAINDWGMYFASLFAFLLGVLLIVVFRSGIRRLFKLLATILIITICSVVFVAVLFVRSRVVELRVPNGYEKQAIRFQSGNSYLAGELLLPRGKTGVPAVVFIIGSDVSSYRTNYGRLANEIISPIFSALGYAVLYFDKRGVGLSGGDWTTSRFEDLADDVYAAVKFLRSVPALNSAKIGVAGHSQGGWISQLVASRHPDVLFMISLAGPSVSVKEQIIDDEMNQQICDGTDTVSARKQVDTLVAEIESKSKLAKSGRYYQYAITHNYTPDRALRNLTQPSLFLFASNDRLVVAKKNMIRIQEIFHHAVPTNITIKEIQGAGHSFRTMDFCYEGPQKGLPYSKEFVQQLTEWLQQR